MTPALYLAVMAAIVSVSRAAGAEGKDDPVTTLTLREYLLSNSPWVNPKTTVDTVKIGEPSKPVRKRQASVGTRRSGGDDRS